MVNFQILSINNQKYFKLTIFQIVLISNQLYIIFKSKFDLIGDIHKYFNRNLIKKLSKLVESKYFDSNAIKSI